MAIRSSMHQAGAAVLSQLLEFDTPSSEQVRQPIFREALDHWRHYEPWLGPLKDALGPLMTYPEVPDSF